ncbi:hypothetical protein N0V84_010721 [Fusarium piperis]|uniref:Uncharacterized protein n=1 Tax=Fusarium piperis TaxID=1435070 RepID=A0A9W8TF73_9HYPO|nr:hypothetical protein N0V84_010721 [Fusarium piperis]
MSAPMDHVLLRPFSDVTKWAKCALLQADGSLGDDYQRIPLNRSSQSLLREGERALRRLTPLLDKPSPQLSDFLRDLALRNNDVVSQVRSIDILLYDFEDFIEPQTYDKAKFDELQAATKELAITLVERITSPGSTIATITVSTSSTSSSSPRYTQAGLSTIITSLNQPFNLWSKLWSSSEKALPHTRIRAARWIPPSSAPT